MKVRELEAALSRYLNCARFKDPSLNGLQVEGWEDAHAVATAATASLEAIEGAVESNADALIVHHGLLWHGQDNRVEGYYRERLKALLDAGISLLAYHLPLDAHLILGNNRGLCDLLGFEDVDYIEPGVPESIAMRCTLSEPKTVAQTAALLCAGLDTRVQVAGSCARDAELREFAVCSGAGSFLIDRASRPDFEALITGEISEQAYHIARENGITVFVTGHDASEQIGVRRLGEYINRVYHLEHHHLHFTVEKDTLIYEHA